MAILVSVSLPRAVRHREPIVAEVASQVDGNDVVVFGFETVGFAVEAADALRSIIARANSITFVNRILIRADAQSARGSTSPSCQGPAKSRALRPPFVAIFV